MKVIHYVNVKAHHTMMCNVTVKGKNTHNTLTKCECIDTVGSECNVQKLKLTYDTLLGLNSHNCKLVHY